MSLNNLLNVNTVLYSEPDGQDKVTAEIKYGNESQIKGRFGESTTRFDTQEAIDQVSDASFSSKSLLVENGKIVFDNKGYLIVDVNVIRNGNGQISHYNYSLKSLDNSNA